MIQYFGLRPAYLTSGILACLLAIPCVWIVRRTPQMLHFASGWRQTDPPQPTRFRQIHLSRRWQGARQPGYIGLSFGLH